MKKIIFTIAMLSTLVANVALAQSRKISGTVRDDQGPLPGASITVKGTTLGTSTDDDGNFTIEVPEDKAYLVVSSFGTTTKEVRIGNSSTYNVVLAQDGGQQLTEATVYGQKLDRRSYTGSLNTVSAKEIANRPVTSVGAALDGAAPGLLVTSASGQPGSNPDIMLRGQGSLSASSAPLIVLDGAPYSGSLTSINPLDIKELVVLKDATAKAVYGARAANGVILITTKRGEISDKPRINFDASVGTLNRFIPEYELLGVRDYYEKAYEGFVHMARNGNPPQGFTSTDFVEFLGGYNAYKVPNDRLINDDPTSPDFGKLLPGDDQLLYNDSWEKEIQRVGIRQNYNLSIQNGNNNSDYYMSLGYTRDQGIVKNSDYSRITGLINVNSKVTDWLKAGFKMQVAYDDQLFHLAASNPSAFSNPFLTSRVMGPIYPVYRYNADGTKMMNEDGTPVYDFGANPGQARPYGQGTNAVASLYNNKPYTIALTGNTVGNLEAKIYRDLTARATISVNYYNANELNYYNSLYGDAASVNGRSDRSTYTNINYTFNQFLTWKPQAKNLNQNDSSEHNFQVTLGHENYNLKNSYLNATRIGFPLAGYEELAMGAGGEGSTSQVDRVRIETYFAQIEYNLKRKYYVSGSFSRNGSSRFSPQSRWGNFGSAGAGWIISDEEFAKSLKKHLDFLKIRFSWGISGNDQINNYYAWMDRFLTYPNAGNPGLLFNNYGNNDLKWEGSVDYNAGIDVATKNNKITGSIDVYSRGSNNLLFFEPLANSVGSTGYYANVGKMRNSGVEITMSATVIEAKRASGFSWHTKANLANNRNAVTEVQGKDSLIGSGTILAKGLPVSSYFLPEYAGVDAETGRATWFKADGSRTMDYQDLGLADYKVFGSSFRPLEGSWSNTLRYKGIDLNFVATFGLGGKYYDGVYARLMSTSSFGQSLHVDVLNSWKQKGDETKSDVQPLFTYLQDPEIQSANSMSSRFLISNSFFRLRNINVGYNLPAKTLNKASITNARIYLAVDNVFNVAARKGVDVNSAFFGNSSFTYFPYRTVVLGVNLGL